MNTDLLPATSSPGLFPFPIFWAKSLGDEAGTLGRSPSYKTSLSPPGGEIGVFVKAFIIVISAH